MPRPKTNGIKLSADYLSLRAEGRMGAPMKSCDQCKYAEWAKTSNGRLHPNKQGRCKFLERKPLDLRLPNAFYWPWMTAPSPNGGAIERGQIYKDDCVFGARS
jgi:hypothetical protein